MEIESLDPQELAEYIWNNAPLSHRHYFDRTTFIQAMANTIVAYQVQQPFREALLAVKQAQSFCADWEATDDL